MKRYAVYQYSAWSGTYRLLAVAAARDAAEASARVKLANCIVGPLYVRAAAGPTPSPEEVPARGAFARTLSPF